MNRMPASPLIMKGLQIAEMSLGIDVLSQKLGTPASLIRDWRLGDAAMPERKFLLLVDILTELDPDWMGR